MSAPESSPFPCRRLSRSGLLGGGLVHSGGLRLRPSLPLYRRALIGHFGCVNALEFSPASSPAGMTLLASGGDDRRVLIWKWNRAVDESVVGAHTVMSTLHNSNIFCLSWTPDARRVLSGGHDEHVIVHDVETKAALDVFLHDTSVYGVSANPENPHVFSTACSNGKIYLYDTRRPQSEDPLLVASRLHPFHSVAFNPREPRLLATSNSTHGLELYDLRHPKRVALDYGNLGGQRTAMSCQFSQDGSRLFGLRRRHPPAVFDLHDPEPHAEFDHPGYYNSCTMKSGSFAGLNDEYVMSGSDDFNVYVWKIPETRGMVTEADFVLRGHRSIVNQVRYNPQFSTIASSGVEKVIQFWSPLNLPGSKKLDPSSEKPEHDRKIFTREEYINLVLQSGSMMTHDYSTESVEENPRMIAFFDSLVTRDMERGFSSNSSDQGSNAGSSDEENEDSAPDGHEGTDSDPGSNPEASFARSSCTISDLISRKRAKLRKRQRRRLKRPRVDPDELQSALKRAKAMITVVDSSTDSSPDEDNEELNRPSSPSSASTTSSSSSSSSSNSSLPSVSMPTELCQSPPPKSSEEMKKEILRALQAAEERDCDKSEEGGEDVRQVGSETSKPSTSSSSSSSAATSTELQRKDEREQFKKCSKGKIKGRKNYRKRSGNSSGEDEGLPKSDNSRKTEKEKHSSSESEN